MCVFQEAKREGCVGDVFILTAPFDRWEHRGRKGPCGKSEKKFLLFPSQPGQPFAALLLPRTFQV